MRRFKYINQWTHKKTGRTYLVFRRPGFSAIPLPPPIGSPEFMAAYNTAFKATQSGQIAVRILAKQLAQEVTRGRSGVYLLLVGEEIVYVGSSFDMPARVKEHRTNGRPFDKAFYIPASDSDRPMLEKILIKAINPTQNRIGKNRLFGAKIYKLNTTYKPPKLSLKNSKP